MSKPIPLNPRGLQLDGRPRIAPASPIQIVHHRPHFVPEAASTGDRSPTGILLLLVSTLVGGMAVVSALELRPTLAASRLGLDRRSAFYLLAGGVYLLATALYAAWQTRLLRALNQAPGDARLMAYANLLVGGLVSLALGFVVLAMAAIIAVLAWLVASALSGPGGWP